MITTLQVEPLLVYNIPQYPAFDEENPLHLPPKKASKANFYKMALLGVVGLFSIVPNTNIQENPIKFTELGFPHYYAKFGTGLPAKLDRETAISIIDSIFLANDIEFQKDYAFSEKEVSFNATAYNEKRRIGYVWLDGHSTTVDCYRSGGRDFYASEQMLPEDMVVYERLLKENERELKYKLKYEFFEKLHKKSYYKLLNLKSHYYRNKELSKEIDEYIAHHSNRSADDYGQEILARYDKTKVNLQEMKQLVTTDEYYIAPFSAFSQRMEYEWNKGEEGRKIVIKRLESLVQEYINWAKSEGRF